jgi:putative Ca2+/H+ antiporter (TMEM165/GDT1 family)
VDAFWLSFVIVLLAELGDKSQLMAMAFAARFHAWTVLVAVAAAALVATGLSVLLGSTLAVVLPANVVSLAAGVAFLAFAAWTLRGDGDAAGDGEVASTRSSGWAIVTVATAFFLAEIGDKTMLAIVALAATENPIGVWIGATAGMVSADALAIAVGALLGSRLPERAIKVFAAGAFVVFGTILVLEGLGVL